MDNVTHSLAGLLLAEAAVQLRRSRPPLPPSFRFGAAAAAVVAANLPDADLLYTSFAADRFAYLLHHRGYTHTVPVAIVGGLVAWGVVRAGWHWRSSGAVAKPAGDPAPRAARELAWRWLLALLLVAVLSHLALDSANSYGVHPFWPVDSRWFYGDALFIVEPWLWVAAAPPLFFASPRPTTRVLLALVLAAGIVLAWTVSAVPAGAALALTVGAALSVGLAARLAPVARAVAGVAGWALVTLVFVAATRSARAAVTSAAARADRAPGAAASGIVDVVVTPAVTNPLCADAIVVDTAAGRYRVATARVATVPALLSVSGCGRPSAGGPLLRPSGRPASDAVRWGAEWGAPLAELVALAAENCEVAAMLRFVRVPVWAPAPPSELDVDDLRYAGRGGRSFAGARVASRPADCARSLPPWRPPREDLVGPLSSGARRSAPRASHVAAGARPCDGPEETVIARVIGGDHCRLPRHRTSARRRA